MRDCRLGVADLKRVYPWPCSGYCPFRGSSDEAEERGSIDDIPLRESLKTFQTKRRYIAGHFKDMTFRSPSLEALKTEAGYSYGIPGPIHVRGHFPCGLLLF